MKIKYPFGKPILGNNEINEIKKVYLKAIYKTAEKVFDYN